MADLSVQILPPGCIAIPEDICAHNLTLAEVGALVLVHCMIASAPVAGPAQTAEFMAVLPGLKDRGVVSAEQHGTTIRLVVDLEAA